VQLTAGEVRDLQAALEKARKLADWAARMQCPGPRNGNSLLSNVEDRVHEIAGLLKGVLQE